jgi:hypothetical protein
MNSFKAGKLCRSDNYYGYYRLWESEVNGRPLLEVPNDCLVLLLESIVSTKDSNYVKVLVEDKVGWMTVHALKRLL